MEASEIKFETSDDGIQHAWYDGCKLGAVIHTDSGIFIIPDGLKIISSDEFANPPVFSFPVKWLPERWRELTPKQTNFIKRLKRISNGARLF